MRKRPVEVVRRTRSMHRKGFGVCEISKMLKIPHQTVSDWISGRRRPKKLFKRSERSKPPEFSSRCPDCGRQMVKVLGRRNPRLAGHHFDSFWRCKGCGLNVGTLGSKVVSAWLTED